MTLRSLLFRSSIIVAGLLLAACVGPTPTVAPSTIVPGTASIPTLTPLAGGYPADTPGASPTPSSYPVQNTQEPTSAPTNAAASETAVDTAPPAKPVTITYHDVNGTFEIVPGSSTIKVGTKVTFQIQSDSGQFHEPYSTTPPYNFDSGPGLADGQTYSFTFDKAGTITLLCGYHGNMQATLIVQP